MGISLPVMAETHVQSDTQQPRYIDFEKRIPSVADSNGFKPALKSHILSGIKCNVFAFVATIVQFGVSIVISLDTEPNGLGMTDMRVNISALHQAEAVMASL